MYINFWYPMALSAEVADTPVRVETLGQPFALFRDVEGIAHCLADTCVHRGGSLGTGRRQGDNLECPYHGWQYDSLGHCVHMPTLADGARIPARARVDAYPVEERYGIIFAFLGDLPENARPPIMPIAEWGQEGWRVTSLQYNWDASFERVIENGLDATHTEFVHPSAGLQGNFKPSDDVVTRLVPAPWGTACQTHSADLEIEHGHHGASHQWTFLTFKSGSFNGRFCFYSFIQPISAHRVRRYLFHARDCQLDDETDLAMHKANLGFEQEDRPVIEQMRPVFSPRDTSSELLLPEDEIMTCFRESLDSWRRKGWQINLSEIRRTAESKVHAIPSPGRREHRNWVVATVPLLPAD